MQPYYITITKTSKISLLTR